MLCELPQKKLLEQNQEILILNFKLTELNSTCDFHFK